MPRKNYRELLLLLLLQVFANQAITFVDNPALLGGIYIPPPGKGDVIAVCSTRNAANITWETSKGVIYRPGNAKLNITQATNRKSILYVSNSDTAAKGILLFDGPFRCRAQDLATLQESTTDYFEFLLGREPSSILRQSPSVNQISTGERVQLFCVMSLVLPPVSVTWLFESGNGQSEQRNSTAETRVLATSELHVFLDVSGKESNGTYRCIVRNEFGEAKSSPMNVIVAYLGNISISITPSGRVVEDNDVRVLVQVDSCPAPFNITIKHNGVVLKTVIGTNTLEYAFKASRNDTGRYLVRAVHVSENKQRSFQITVLSPPGEVQFFIVNVSHNSVTYRWAVGFNGNVDVTKITLCCGENADDVSQNSCSVSAKSQETDVLTSSRTEDTLVGLFPNTVYYCKLFAMNEIGVTPSGTLQSITTKPTVPSEPNITSCISMPETSLTVNWTTFNGGSTIIRYVIRYQVVGSINEGQSLTQTDGIMQAGGSVQLTKLNKLTNYSIQIEAENSVGKSFFGQTQCLTTCDLLAPFEVTRLAVKGGQEFQLNVDDRCGNVTEFVSTSCTEEPLNTISRRLSNNTFRVTVTGLKTDQDCVMIKAITDNGISSIYSILKIPVEGSLVEDNTVVIIAVSVPVATIVFIAVAVIVIYILWRNRNTGTCTVTSASSTGSKADISGEKTQTVEKEEEITTGEKAETASTSESDQDTRKKSPNALLYAEIAIPSEKDRPRARRWDSPTLYSEIKGTQTVAVEEIEMKSIEDHHTSNND